MNTKSFVALMVANYKSVGSVFNLNDFGELIVIGAYAFSDVSFDVGDFSPEGLTVGMARRVQAAEFVMFSAELEYAAATSRTCSCQ